MAGRRGRQKGVWRRVERPWRQEKSQGRHVRQEGSNSREGEAPNYVYLRVQEMHSISKLLISRVVNKL
jgi:hypothetical protein